MEVLSLNLCKFWFIFPPTDSFPPQISALLPNIYFLHVLSAMGFLIFWLCLFSFLYFPLFNELRTPLRSDKLHLKDDCPVSHRGAQPHGDAFCLGESEYFLHKLYRYHAIPCHALFGVSCLMLFSKSCYNVVSITFRLVTLLQKKSGSKLSGLCPLCKRK